MAIDRTAPAGIDLDRTLGAALELENGELAAFEGGEPAGGRAARSGPARALRSVPLVVLPLKETKARSFAPATAILRRHGQGKSSLEEAMLELYHGNISVAGAEEVARQLWGEATSVALVADSSRSITGRIQAWLQREIVEPQVYVFLESIELKQKIRGENRFTRLAAAVGVGRQGTRRILAVMGTAGPADGPWDRLIADLQRRGLRGTQLFIGGNCPAAVAAVTGRFPGARYQGCLAQLEREILAKVGPDQLLSLRRSLTDLRSSATENQALRAAQAVVAGLRKNDAPEAAALLEQSARFLFSYLDFPRTHQDRLQDFEPLRRVLREFRETIRLIGPVPDPVALTVLLAARLRHAARQSWARRRYISL